MIGREVDDEAVAQITAKRARVKEIEAATAAKRVQDVPGDGEAQRWGQTFALAQTCAYQRVHASPFGLTVLVEDRLLVAVV